MSCVSSRLDFAVKNKDHETEKSAFRPYQVGGHFARIWGARRILAVHAWGIPIRGFIPVPVATEAKTLKNPTLLVIL